MIVCHDSDSGFCDSDTIVIVKMGIDSHPYRTAYDMQIDGKRGAGRPKQTWNKLTEKECREWKLTTVDPQERSTWRSGVRSAMRAASQLPGKGPTDVDDAPAPESKIRLC